MESTKIATTTILQFIFNYAVEHSKTPRNKSNKIEGQANKKKKKKT